MIAPLVIAHRGDSAHRPENTLAAFAGALEVGAALVELDVQLTADGHVIVLHDPDLDRTTTGRGDVRRLTLADVRSVSAGYPDRFGSAYAGEREQFGRPISKFQAIQFKLADIATELEAARWLTYRAAYLRDTGQPFLKEASMAKLKASRLAVSAASEAVQIHGGLGYMLESPVARFYCDAKVLEIGEGTNEIQHMVIARTLGC